MKAFKKAVFISLIFLIIFTVISSILILPVFHTEYLYYMDRYLSQSLTGTIDFVVCGASHGLTAFDSKIIDEKLNCNSYNLCGSLLTWEGREALLDRELEKNPIKTLILEISEDTLQREPGEKNLEGHLNVLPRLDSVKTRMKYLFENISFNEFDDTYSTFAYYGVSFYKSLVLKNSIKNVDYDAKGFHFYKTTDITLTDDEILSNFTKGDETTEFNKSNLKILDSIVKKCYAKKIKVVFVVTPISDNSIWSISYLDDFKNKLDALGKQYNCEVIDFNLLKNRYEIFSDSESFFNLLHLSKNGSETFTLKFCEIYEKFLHGENIDKYFYSTYSDLKNNSPYMKRYTELKTIQKSKVK